MKGLCRTALAILVIAACGRDGAITEPAAPNARALQPGVLALGVDSTTGASIETNKDDYVPGEVVHLVGRGWAPGETVNLHMVEEPNTHADVDTNVVADASGGFSIHFYDVQVHDWGVTFTLTATGRTSGSVAVATFTDGIFQIGILSNPAAAFSSIDYKVRNGCNAGTGSTGVLTHTVGGTRIDVNASKVLIFRIPSPSGYTYQSVTASGLTVTLVADSLCITGGSPSGPNQNKDVTLNYTVANSAPVVDAGGPYSGAEGSAISLSGATATDPDAGDVPTYSWSVSTTGIDAGGSCSFSPSNAVLNPSVTCTDDSGAAAGGKFVLTLQVDDGNGHVVSDNADLTVSNADPVAEAGGPYTGNEGANVSLSGSRTDAGSNDSHTYKWTWAVQSGVDPNAACTFSNDAVLNPTVSCTDDGVYTLTLEVTDDDGATDTDDATLTLSNVAPTFTLTSPAAGSLFSLLNGAISATAGSIADAGINDTHECRAELDGVSVGLYAAATGTTCTASVLPNEAGVYTLTLRVKDDDGGEATASVMIVVYDPSAGFVTGGGWIQSDAGFYKPDVTLSGKATFGFVSKYKRGATIPEGNTEFQFHAGGMNFHSSTYQWLVVNQAGTNAQFKGTGTINGSGNYTFMLWATDGGNTGDKFRIQITDSNNVVVYDNGVDQVISGGSIVIHTGGKK